MSKKKIFAIVLFVLVSLYMFSFASPREIDMTPINTTYTVEFVDYDGISLETVTVAQGEDAKYEGKELVREADNKCNYDFDAWSEDITDVQEDLVVIAKYACNPINYTLTYNANGMANAVVAGNHNFNYLTATYALVNATSPSHNFLGWYTQAVGGNKVAFLLVGSTGNRTVFGHWAIKTNAVTFNSNGGTDVLEQTIDYNNKILKPENPTRTGYTFSGWYSDQALTTLWDFDNDLVINPVMLYAGWTVDEYTITYNLNGGINHTDNPTTYDIEDNNITLLNPTRTGYTFEGWYETADFSSAKVTEIVTSRLENIALYANWTVDTYTITYNLNGGVNGLNPSTYDVEDTDITLLNPTRTGYTFEGWYETSDFSTSKVTEITTSRLENITLYANWTLDTYTITYNLNGGVNGSNPSTYDVEDNDITLLNPTKLGHDFIGWYEASNFSGSKTTEIDTARAVNITLYAKWVDSIFNMTINLNGGSTWGVSKNNYPIFLTPTIYNLKMGDIIKIVEPFKNGYTFAGWTINGDVTTTQYYDSFFNVNVYVFTIKTDNVSIAANWNTKSYSINYVLNGGTNNPNQTGYTVETNDITLLNPTRTGYTFKGWYERSNFTGSATTVIDTARATNITLYAKWEINSYTITYNLDGGTNNPSNPTSFDALDTDIVLANPTKNGYTFGGWYGDANFSLPEINGIDTAITTNVTLYAKWEINAYTITFDTNGGTPIPSITQNFGTAIVAPSNPTRVGYTFGGWDKTIPTTMPGSNMTITAIWNAISYTITFNGNGVTDAVLPGNTSYTILTGVSSFTDATSNTNNFLGWYTQAVDGSKVTSIAVGHIGDITLYAHWSIKTYAVTFNSNGGSTVNAQNIGIGGKATEPTDPTKTDYTFGGWYVDNTTFTNPWNFNTVVTNDMTLYAKWVQNTHTLTINFAGGNIYLPGGGLDPNWANLTRPISNGGTLVIPNPWKNNNMFIGWEVKSGNGTVKDNHNGTWTFTMGTTDTSIQAKYWH